MKLKNFWMMTAMTLNDRTTPWSFEFETKMRNMFTMSQEEHVSHRSPWYGLPGEIMDEFLNGMHGP
jgi:hypothetical protein